ncbi:carbohydrate binding domain-containing protein [Microbispora amethystogenes]|uniref:carbohydrate binding domain-containing protein n=1 Tax=Microbispora amethystogenes TaxID=1427754 RepID=UPI0033F4B8CC
MTYIVPLVVELYLGGTWVDVTVPKHVERRNLITITRGQSGEASQTEHSTAALSLNNTGGTYSPRNPLSPYYGQLGRNTPLRVAVLQGSTYLAVPGTNGARATCPDTAAVSVTGDLDIRIEVTLASWRADVDLAGKYTTTGNQRSWALYLSANGTLSLAWSANGSTVLTRTSTAAVPAPGSARQAVRAVLDVNNGSSGHTVYFYAAPAMAGPWVQIGDPVVTAGTTSVFDSTAVVEVGDVTNLIAPAVNGKVHRFEMRNGINGTLVANPDFTTQTPGAASFADASGNTWSVTGGATITNRRYRFHGEVSAWPTRSDRSGRDVYVPLEAAGVLRRLSQGSAVLRSALYRGNLFNAPGLVAYWPFEDEQGSTSMAAALAHGPMSVIGQPKLAEYDAFAASAPIPVLNGAEMRGAVPSYTDTGSTQVRFLLAVPSTGAETGQSLILWYGTGSVRRWDVYYGTGGTLRVDATSPDNVLIGTTGDISFAVNGKNLLVSVELVQSGSNIGVTLSTLAPGASVGQTTTTTITGQTVGRVGGMNVSNGGGIANTAIGHVTVQNQITSLFNLGPQLEAWAGEAAGRRIERLCREGGIAFAARGDLDDTVRLGAQQQADLVALIREAVDADAGILFEPRDFLGLGYRTRASLYNQAPALALPYTALGDSLDPVDDDQLTRNDVTVERVGGSSARAVQESGPMSVLPPPAGVGRGYDSSDKVNVEYDLQLFDQATWRLHLGTVNEARVPQIPLNMIVNALFNSPSLTEAVLELDPGDRVTISGLPAWLPPEDVSQLVLGHTETLGGTTHLIQLNCEPESPYQVATYQSGNLVTNPSFEADTSGWQSNGSATITRTTAQAYTGSASAQVTKASGNTISVELSTAGAVAVPAGQKVTISAYVLIPAAVYSQVSDVRVVDATTDGAIDGASVGKPSAADMWQRVALTQVVNPGTTLTRFQVQFVTSGVSVGAVVAYVDAAAVRSAETDAQVARYGPTASTLASGVNATATSLSVATVGPLWTTDMAEFPIDVMVGGERMTITRITGSSSPQTFTVRRSVNGIAKSQATGAAVELFRPAVYAL